MGRFHLDRRRWLVSAAAASAAAILPARAGAQNAKVAEAAGLTGPDRAKKILDGAKSEGSLTLYTNAPTDDNKALTGGFEKKYGVKINLYRASSEEIRQRVINEARGRRFEVDLILNNSPAMEALNSERLLQEVKSPYLGDLMPGAMPPYRTWAGFCLNVLVSAYNTNLLKKEDLPNSYQDLLDPRWKGKIAIEADDSDWFAGLVGQMGQEKGVKLFRDIADTNGFSIRKGHTLLANLIAAGEVPLALTIFNYTAEQLKKRKAPVDWFTLDPLVAHPNAIAVAANAPRPYAAVLLFDYILSDAQQLLADRDYVVTSTKIKSPVNRSSIHMLDAAKVVAEGEKWQILYTQIINAHR